MTTIPLPPHSKIALLICDPTKKEFIDSYGNITNLFTSLYTKLLIRFTEDGKAFDPFLPDVMKSFRIDPFNAMQGQLPALDEVDKYASIIVSGSANSPYDDEEWIKKLGTFLHTTATKHRNVKLIGKCRYLQQNVYSFLTHMATGICFGHQLIAQAVFGSPVGPNPQGWEIGPYNITLSHTGKELFRGVDNLVRALFHRNAVFSKSQLAFFKHLREEAPYETNVPENSFHIWGHSEKTENQGFVAWNKEAEKSGKLNVDDIHIFTCQGHPELTQGMTSYLLDLFEDKVDPESVIEARARIANFKGILDWYRITMIMWALSTRHSFVLSGVPSLDIPSPEDPIKTDSVFVLVT
ncbi:class I glutamine amidotransferase-like protein [Leucogyrophana mollusca]|uniref:Class I glutamine amidotransferase-like protein n=1 Tax=Leucogyrophana mollusca TaxID=85980 RepID=A0ACB8BND2_9AGAM|nr:class I glutamine amidotransferase-like protein [Leucogyrophana mollusca]